MPQGPISEPSLVHGLQTSFQTVVLNLVSWGQAVGATLGAIFGFVAGQFLSASTDQISSGIALAQEQLAAGRAFGTEDVYHRPKLSQIPICPGCPAGQIEVEIRVVVSGVTPGNSDTTEGVVRAIFNHIPDHSEIEDIAAEFAETLFAQSPIDPRGFQHSYVVSSAQRGAFFGR